MNYVLLYCGRCPWSFPANASALEDRPFMCPRCLNDEMQVINTDDSRDLAAWFETRGLPNPPWVLEALSLPVHSAARDDSQPAGIVVRPPRLLGEEDEDDIPRDD